VNKPSFIARSTKVAARMVGDEMMIMSGRDSMLFTLNPTGAALWEAADGVTPLEDIVTRQICAKYDVEPERAIRDAEELVEQLAGRGLLLVSDTPIAAGGAPESNR
jgi:hypothetical protein